MAGVNGNSLTAKKRADFLEALADTCNVSEAAQRVGISRKVLYDRRNSDEAFREAWEKARGTGAEALEDELTRRAMGYDHEVIDSDGNVNTVRRYSDTLGIFLLKGAMPHKYRDRVEHTGEGGGPMQVVISRQGDEDE